MWSLQETLQCVLLWRRKPTETFLAKQGGREQRETECDLHCRVETIESATTTRLIAWRKHIITLHCFYLCDCFFFFVMYLFRAFQFEFESNNFIKIEITFHMQLNAMSDV